MNARYYAGIGSRETPRIQLAAMREIARHLAVFHGMVLRSGGADGADAAFERGCDEAGGLKQIFLPWDGFNGRRKDRMRGVFAGVGPEAMKLAAQHHPAWGSCGRGARSLHARNGYQVLGPKLDSPVEFIVCWTKHAMGQGGTGQALRIAQARGITIYDLGSDETLFHLGADLGIVL